MKTNSLKKVMKLFFIGAFAINLAFAESLTKDELISDDAAELKTIIAGLSVTDTSKINDTFIRAAFIAFSENNDFIEQVTNLQVSKVSDDKCLNQNSPMVVLVSNKLEICDGKYTFATVEEVIGEVATALAMKHESQIKDILVNDYNQSAEINKKDFKKMSLWTQLNAETLMGQNKNTQYCIESVDARMFVDNNELQGLISYSLKRNNQIFERIINQEGGHVPYKVGQSVFEQRDTKDAAIGSVLACGLSFLAPVLVPYICGGGAIATGVVMYEDGTRIGDQERDFENMVIATTNKLEFQIDRLFNRFNACEGSRIDSKINTDL